MKTNQQITPAAPDWTRARGLLADLKSAVRRSLSAQILIGKETRTIKAQLGFSGSGRRAEESRQFGGFKSWDQWCQEELGIPARSVDRYIQCFEAAKACAKRLHTKASTEGDTARAKKFGKALKLLEIPAAELAGGELKSLAEHVGFLIERKAIEKHPTAAANITQGELLEELGIKNPSKPTTGGDTSNHGGDGAKAVFEQMVFDLFSEITSGLGAIEKKIFRGRSRAEFQAMLEWIPLASDDKNAPCLYTIRDSLRGVLDGELPKMIAAVETAIKEKESPGIPAKKTRGKLTNA